MSQLAFLSSSSRHQLMEMILFPHASPTKYLFLNSHLQFSLGGEINSLAIVQNI